MLQTIGANECNQLIALREIMKRLEARTLLDSANYLGYIEGAGKARVEDQDNPMSEETLDIIRRSLSEFRETLETAGLTLSATLAQWLLSQVKTGLTFGRFASISEELHRRVSDEIDNVLLISLDANAGSLYEQTSPFGEQVAQNFPSASMDIEEAAKCLALSRYTACVFHLMRVAETGLTVMAKRIGLSNPRTGWEEAITYLEAHLNKRRAEMEDRFRGDIDALRGLAAHMRDVNIAWRRRVAHIESKYTEEEARRIYNATRGLMEHMATIFSEVAEEAP